MAVSNETCKIVMYEGGADLKSLVSISSEREPSLVSMYRSFSRKRLSPVNVLKVVLVELSQITKSEKVDLALFEKANGTRYLNDPEGPPFDIVFDSDSQDIVISNKVDTDPRARNRLASGSARGKTPRETLAERGPLQGALSTYMSIPIRSKGKKIGKLCFANRLEGYTTEVVSNVLPYCKIVKSLLKKMVKPRVDGSAVMLSKKRGADDAKDKFLSTMSHELRTPLNGIVGMVNMLADAGPLTKKQEEYLLILSECSSQLMNLMNNILDFSKMSANRLALLRNPFMVSKAMQDAVAMVEGRAKAKSLDLRIDIQKDIHPLIGDSQRLTQIVSNLLVNAVKFTDKGYVELKVRAICLPHPESEPYAKKWKVHVDVKDTGVGIEAEEREKIFSAFHQSPTLNTNMSRNGTGLGLSIARELVRLMSGKIKVKSEGIKGKGSTFSFYVILDEEICIDLLHRQHQDLLKNAKILVVDDRPEYRLQLSSILFSWSCIPTVVSSGEEALQYLEHGVGFSAAIIDVVMPFLNGVELAQEMRSKYRDIPLIAISSVELTTSGGTEMFDHFLYKPIDRSQLFPVLLQSLAKSAGGSKIVPSLSLRVTPPLSGKRLERRPKNKLRILIAEDDSRNAYTLKEMLGYLGFNPRRIKWVDNGEKCVAEARRKSYDILLLDVIMPVMDGLTVTTHIRQMKKQPYIIAVSAAVQPSDKQRCQEVGIHSYLTKPVLRDKLEAMLGTFVLPSSP